MKKKEREQAEEFKEIPTKVVILIEFKSHVLPLQYFIYLLSN